MLDSTGALGTSVQVSCSDAVVWALLGLELNCSVILALRVPH